MTAPAPLVVVGAGGLAREAAEAVRACNQARPTWDLRGFLDDDPAKLGRSVAGHRVLGPVDSVQEHQDAAVLLCTGRPGDQASRQRLAQRLGLPEQRYATVVHPAAVVPSGARLGAGTVVLATAVLTESIRVGSHVVLMPGTVLTHDDVVEDFVTFGAGVRLGGGVHVQEGAYVGSGALVREGVRVGAWSLVGMGSVVLRDVPAGTVCVGSPARVLRPNDVERASARGADRSKRG